MAFSERKPILKFVKIISRQFDYLKLNSEQGYSGKNTEKRIFKFPTAKILGNSLMKVQNSSK